MSNVYRFPEKGIKVHRMCCDNCLLGLEYWLGDNDFAYGLCPRCDLKSPDTITIPVGEDE